MPKVNIGVSVSNRALIFMKETYKLEHLLELSRMADEYGWYAISLGDGFLSKPRWDPIVLHAAIAMVTKKIRLATATLNINYRNPLQFARDWAVLDNISNGRTWLGIGVGSSSRGPTDDRTQVITLEDEMKLSGNERYLSRRGTWLAEWVQLCRTLWSKDRVSFHGKSFDYDNITIEPKPLQQPYPITMSAGGGTLKDVALERLAKYSDGWLTVFVNPPVFREHWERLKERLKSYGKDPSKYDVSDHVAGAIGDDLPLLRREMVDWLKGYYGAADPNTLDQWGPLGDADTWIKWIGDCAEAGVKTFLIRLASSDPKRQLELLSKQVLPSF